MKVVFIGAGRITRWFLDDIKNTKYHDDIVPYGIYNLTIEQAKEYQEKYQMAKVYHSLEELIADHANYDLAYIGTSDGTHYEIAKPLLAHKINVYCEKPLALTYHQATELYELAHQNNVLLFDGIKTGFSKAYQAMKKDLANGIIGEVQYVQASHAKVSTSGKIANPQPTDKNFVGFHLAGGMYALFISLDILGPAKVVNYLNNYYNSVHPAIATSVLNLRHENNGISTVLGSDTLTNDLSAMLLGTKGYIKLGGNLAKYNADYHKDSCHMAYTYEVYDNQSHLIKTVDLPIQTAGEGLCLEIEHVYELLQANKTTSPIMTPAISLAIIKILELTNNVNDTKVIKLT
ncbi:Gfo/Idh/MocA family protein [Spiroplasma sp. DGKH1]|uniref:Gfo/Idh/MocA family protein n=1 Tax=Spiroplasma sp. DGKH1 TaxID=3050074 RepID=UPI0034C6870D